MSHVNWHMYWLLAVGLALVVGAIVAGGLTALTRRWVAALPATLRHHVLLLLIASPFALGVSLIVGVMLPSVPSLFTGVDHCVTHDDAHVHLCFLHAPHESLDAWLMVTLSVGAGWLVWRALRGALRVRRSQRLVRTLIGSSVRRLHGGGYLLDSLEHVCVTAGLWAPRVLVSRGLWQRLDPTERRIVLAHEIEHQRRHDIPLRTLARAAALFHLPWVGQGLLRELEVASEQACDDAAAQVVGDRLLVAEVLLKVARLQQVSVPRGFRAVAVGLGGTALERRVRGLVEESARPRSSWPIQTLVWLLFVAPLLAAGELHHAAESLISFVVR